MQPAGTFAATLHQARQRLGLTQKQMAQRLGIAQATCSMLERGERGPGIEVARQLAALLNVPIEQILEPGELGEQRPALVRLMTVAEELNDDQLDLITSLAKAVRDHAQRRGE